MLEKTIRINFLFDFYQALLTPKQRNYMEMYYLKDYSLGEIAKDSNVSRQAVYDNIRRTESMLESYEKRLHLYDKFQQRSKIIEQIKNNVAEKDYDRLDMLINQLKELD